MSRLKSTPKPASPAAAAPSTRAERLQLIGADDDDPSRTVHVEYRPLTGRGATQRMRYFALIADGERVGTISQIPTRGRVRPTQLRLAAARILGATSAQVAAAA